MRGSVVRFSPHLLTAVLLVALYGGNLCAQDASIERPILGFTVDDTGATISPIVGVVGASVLDQSVQLGFDVRNIVISPEHNYALAERNEDGTVVLLKLLETTAGVVELPAARGGTNLIAVSPRATAAAFLGSDGFLQTFRGMPDTPELVYEFDTSILAGQPTAIAVNDIGNIALITLADREAGSSTAWVTTANGALWAVPSSHISSMAFLPHRADAIFGDADTQEIFLVLDLDGTGNRIPLLSLNGAAGTPMTLSASPDGRFVYAISAGSQEVTIADAQTSTSTVIDCSCRPTRLERLTENAVLLDASPTDLLHVLDVSAAEPRIVVIPRQQNTTQPERSEVQ